MAMDGDALGTAIGDAIAAAFGPMAAGDKAKIVDAWKIACNEIVDHIIANAEVGTTVSTTLAVAPHPVGGAATGTGSGSGTGTITA